MKGFIQVNIVLLIKIKKILGLKPFSCQFCGRAFRQRSQQMGHEATHASGSNAISGLALANQTLSLQQQTNRDLQRDSLSSEQVNFFHVLVLK